MKILIPILALLVSSACHASALKGEDISANPNPTVNSSNTNNLSSYPNDVSRVDQTRSELETQNERFRIAPDNFRQIDFKNFSYPYRFSNRRRDIALRNGEYEYDFSDDRGWFNLSDVYYVDVTGDGNPEAIVMLGHVSCGVSCDGGADLFYIYTAHQNRLNLLWQYETGSLAYGCGLKTFTVRNGRITMELFGRCVNETEGFAGVKFQVRDTTRLTFRFNGRRFVMEGSEVISVPERSVMNYQPEISINE